MTGKGANELSWEAMSLRIGMLLSYNTYCLGSTVTNILFKDIVRHTKPNLSTKLRLLAANRQFENSEFDPLQAVQLIKQINKRKHKTKQDIVMLKQFEAGVNPVFQEFLDLQTKSLQKFGLAQMKALSEDPNSRLSLWQFEPYNCEQQEFALSDVFRYEYIEGLSLAEPDVWTLYDKTAVLKEHVTQLTHLAILPNLIFLSNEQLMEARKALEPLREKLANQLPLMEANKEGKKYLTGTWNVNGLTEVSQELQEAIDNNTSLKWAAKMDANRIKLQVGMVDTLKLWEMLHELELMPEATWNALQPDRENKDRCPHVPVFLASADNQTELTAALSEEQLTAFKRKTLDID